MKHLPFFYVLKGFNPFEHLAAEDFLLRSCHGFGMAVWVARPCVVMGRFQNPWREVYWQKAKSKDVWIVRRQSGGGTVYQDRGNLNFAFFGDLKKLDKNLHLELVRKAIGFFGIVLKQNERHDLVYEDRGQTFKVSGNAFKQTRDRFLHHGTLLIDANINDLGVLLYPPNWEIQTKAVDSKRSPVVNLNDVPRTSLEFNVNSVIEALKEVFKSYWISLGVNQFQVKDVDSCAVLDTTALTNLVSSKWIWGETPKFYWNLGDHKFYFAQGRLQKISGPTVSHLEFLRNIEVWRENLQVKSELNSLSGIFNTDQLSQLKDFFGLA